MNKENRIDFTNLCSFDRFRNRLNDLDIRPKRFREIGLKYLDSRFKRFRNSFINRL